MWPYAGLAQLVEQLPCKHQVVGSNPTSGTKTTHQKEVPMGWAFNAATGFVGAWFFFYWIVETIGWIFY